MATKGIIDRIEGELVVVELENGKTKDYDLQLFPKNIAPGVAVYMVNNKFEIDEIKTKTLEKEILDLMDELFEK